MFEFVRTHNRLLQAVLIILVFPAFVIVSCQGYDRFTGSGAQTVAKVDGHNITQADWDAAVQRQGEQMRRQTPSLDPKLFDSPQFKHEVLEQMLRERVLFAAAQQQHLSISDQRLQRELLAVPQLAALRRPDGSIDVDGYKALLAAQGMSPEQFEASVRQDGTLRQVLGAIADSSIDAPAVARLGADALLQQREVQLQRFDAASYAARLQPGEADLEAYYKAHAEALRAPEQAQIEYVVLDLGALGKDIALPEAELHKYYEENVARYSSAEERRASHILVKADKDAPADARAKAKAKAEQLVAELRKEPGKFAELAKKNSDDPGSAERGGDLDFFGRGAMVKSFEDAAFAMKPGEISNPVESEFGWHIIRLDAVRGGDKKPFDSVRAEIETEVRKQLAQKRYAEAAEQFSNTVYEQSDSLQPVIDKLKLDKRSATVQRQPAAGASGALASQKLIDAVFSNDVLRNKRNTDAVEIGPNQLASARVVQHMPARVLPLAEVRDQVRQRVIAEQAAALSRKDGEARVAALAKGEGTAGLPAPVLVSRAQTQGLSPMVVDAILRADAAKLPSAFGVEVPGQGYVALRLTKVQTPPAADPQAALLVPRVAQAWALAEGQAYYDALKSRFGAQFKGPGLPPAASAPQ